MIVTRFGESLHARDSLTVWDAEDCLTQILPSLPPRAAPWGRSFVSLLQGKGENNRVQVAALRLARRQQAATNPADKRGNGGALPAAVEGNAPGHESCPP